MAAIQVPNRERNTNDEGQGALVSGLLMQTGWIYFVIGLLQSPARGARRKGIRKIHDEPGDVKKLPSYCKSSWR